jgi:hypothetical protein
MEVEVNTTPRLFNPRKDTRYPFYRTLSGLQGWSGRVRVDIVVLGRGFLRVSRGFAVEFYFPVFITHTFSLSIDAI